MARGGQRREGHGCGRVIRYNHRADKAEMVWYCNFYHTLVDEERSSTEKKDVKNSVQSIERF